MPSIVVSPISTLSVISRHMHSGGAPVRSSAAATCATRSGCASWRAERFTAIVNVGETAPDARHSISWRHALVEHPRAERDDQPGLLGQVDERVRRDQPALGVLPPHEGLGARARAAGQLDDRLEVDPQLVTLDRAVERVLGLEPGPRRGAHLLVEELASSLARSTLARYIAASASRSSVSGLSPGPASAIPMLALRCWSSPLSWIGASITSSSRSRDVDRLAPCVLRRQVVAEDGELVATEACHRVPGPHRRSTGACRA